MNLVKSIPMKFGDYLSIINGESRDVARTHGIYHFPDIVLHAVKEDSNRFVQETTRIVQARQTQERNELLDGLAAMCLAADDSEFRLKWESATKSEELKSLAKEKYSLLDGNQNTNPAMRAFKEVAKTLDYKI